MRRYDVAGVDWTDANIPPEEVEFLKKTLADSEKPCIIMVHQNLDFNVGWKSCIIKNAAEVRELLEASGKVDLVIQGHFHPGCDNEIGGIRYFTVAGLYENETARFCTLEISENGCVIEKFE
jgi:alkaline phosphatase